MVQDGEYVNLGDPLDSLKKKSMPKQVRDDKDWQMIQWKSDLLIVL